MRILCVEQFSNLGGGQRSLLDLLPAFCERGWDPSVMAPDEGPLTAELRSLGYPVELLHPSTYTSSRKPLHELFGYGREFPRLARILNQAAAHNNTQLIYVNGARFLPPAAWVARSRKIPLVFHCHSRLQQRSAILLAEVSVRMCRSHIIGCCRFAVEPFTVHVPAEHVTIIYNGVALRGDFPLLMPSKLRRIGVIGRIEPEKGQLDFVRAAHLIRREVPACQFVVAGAPQFAGREYSDRVVAASRGLPIDFLGWQGDIASVLADLDLLVAPSGALEGTTRVIMEAFSAGVPVVAFPSGGIPEIVRDGENGFLAYAPTPEALAERIISVLRMDARQVLRITRAARMDWQEHYTLKRYRSQVCDLVANILQPDRAMELTAHVPEFSVRSE